MKNIIITLVAFIWGVASFAQTDKTVFGTSSLNLEVEVIDRETNYPIDGVNVYLYEMPRGELINQAITSGGSAHFSIDPLKNYEVRTCHSKYLDGGMSIYENYSKRNQLLFCVSGAKLYGFNVDGSNADLYAQLPLDEIVVGKTFKLENIYFDLDKAFLRREAKRELDKLVDIMNRFPSLEIEMGSHTDSRASHAYNDDLSQRRAESTYNYLIEKGISPNRLTYQGYGENQLVNECADGVKCSEAKHQLNRRTEFKITRFDGASCGTPKQTINKSYHCCD